MQIIETGITIRTVKIHVLTLQKTVIGTCLSHAWSQQKKKLGSKKEDS